MGERKRVRRVSEELRRTARELRISATDAEALLWEVLRAGQLEGLKFRRQHAVGRFVLDFYCPSAKLAIEVDGGIHDQQQERDEARTAELTAHGCRVLRVRNEDVLHSLPAVLDRILSAARPQPPLPELGEGVASPSEPGVRASPG
ncbi:MAG: endonuclease domain-containing protein [Longimicrobiaceae bacterium]